MSATYGVRWGWSVPCRQPACGRPLERWGPSTNRLGGGPPVLANPDPAWFFEAVHCSSDYGQDYHPNCRSHAQHAKAWKVAYIQWLHDRRQLGRQESWWAAHLKVAFPALAPHLVGESVHAWEARNRMPVPPWVTR